MLGFLRFHRPRDVVYEQITDSSAQPPEPTTMTTSDDGKAFLQVCVAKRLLDPEQAKEIWSRTQQTGETPQSLLVERGLMASHTVQALEKELRRAQGPRIIGGFQLIKQIGQGGMATVYLARQISLGREVALKLMAPQIAANPDAADRFLREARVAAAVNHPNVISIIDVAQTDGQLYMALEMVSGGDAAQLAARFGGTLPEARALELLIDCTKGLQALYEARLVHRDLKPSNIFITSEGTAKLGDLGLARSEDGADRMTATGNLVGTPAFMSPEQAGGDGTVDIRSDIYALGATLFALVTGRQPFVANNPIAVAAKALTEPAPDPRSLAPNLSAFTATLILRSMAKSATDRFQTPRELREALEQALAQAPQAKQSKIRSSSATIESNELSPPSPSPRAHRTPSSDNVRKNSLPTSWLLATLAMLTLVVGVRLIFWPQNTVKLSAPVDRIVTPDVVANNKLTILPSSSSSAPTATGINHSSAASTQPQTLAPSTTTMANSIEPSAHTSGYLPVATSVEASIPPGEDPPRVPWAASQGKDAFGHWVIVVVKGEQQRLRWLPPGTCVIGSPMDEAGHNSENENQSTVTFTYGSWLADTECSQGFWQAVTGKNPSSPVGPRFPVNTISVAEAIAFTHTLRQQVPGAHVRLPSRAEWERACRAGSTTIYATGNDVGSLAGYANLFDEDRDKATPNGTGLSFADGFVDVAPIASFKPNRWGYFDLHGNVAEYCLGIWSSLPAISRDPLTDDAPNAQIGCVRGGSFDSEGSDLCRSAAMPNIGKNARTPDIGFRFLIEGR
jgi:serine/threonine protein kinase/formylglycine-generating enzyme required for sulfatase activity